MAPDVAPGLFSCWMVGAFYHGNNVLSRAICRVQIAQCKSHVLYVARSGLYPFATFVQWRQLAKCIGLDRACRIGWRDGGSTASLARH